MFRLRLKLFRCECGWQGQTYANPDTTEITHSACGGKAQEVEARFNEAGNRLVPINPQEEERTDG